MGGCCSLCVALVCSKTVKSNEISFNIIHDIGDLLSRFNISLPFSLHNWRFKLNDDNKDKIKKNIAPYIMNYFKNNNIKALQLNGFYDHYISFQISYAIMYKMIDPSYRFEIIANIPIDTIFYTKPSLPVNNIKTFIDNFYTFPEKEIKQDTENSAEHALLDKQFKNLFENAINRLDINDIIDKSHTSYIELQVAKEREKNELLNII